MEADKVEVEDRQRSKDVVALTNVAINLGKKVCVSFPRLETSQSSLGTPTFIDVGSGWQIRVLGRSSES